MKSLMEFLDLFVVALMPVLRVLLISGLGLFLATERIDVLGATARQNLNNLVFYVFSPALIGSSLADTITIKSFATLWFMPVNIFLAFVIGSILGLILTKITKTPPKLRGLVIGCCSAGNIGNLLLVILPAVCDEADSPFGDSPSCSVYAESYAALSLAILVVYLWSYVYILMRVSSATEEVVEAVEEINNRSPDGRDALLTTEVETRITSRIMQSIRGVTRHLKLKMIMAPATIAAIVGFFIGTISPIRKILIGDSAPLRVIYNSTSLLGEAAIPAMILIVGGNLLKGLKGSGLGFPIILGIIVIRYVALPLSGIGVLKLARHFGMVGTDALYQYTLLIQYAVPPAMNIGTIAQLLDAGQSECSVIMLWTYTSASFALTMWSAFFMSLVA